MGRWFGDGLGTANAILTLAQYSRNVGDHDRARAMGEEGAVLGKAVGDVYGIWRTHGMFGDILLAAGDLKRAYQFHAESLDAARRLNDPWSIAQGLRRLGMDVWQQGDLDRATALMEEAVERFAAVGVRRGQHWAAVALGQIALERGDLPRARRWLGEAVTLCHAVDERRWLAAAFEGGAAALATDGEPLAALDAAARILGAAETLRVQIGLPIPPAEQHLIDRAEAAARAALGDAAFEAARAEGAALSLDEAVDMAVAALAQATDRA